MASGAVPGTWTEQYVGTSLDLAGYSQTFADEFNSLSVTTTTGSGPWYSPVHSDYGSAHFVSPDSPDSPFSAAGGYLTISMTQQADGDWQSGTMQTVNDAGEGFAQQYGYFEIRAAFEGGLGAWPAFWMLPQDETIPRPEIDIVEAYGGDPDGHHQAVHLTTDGVHDFDSNYQGLSRTELGGITSLFDGAFHTYGMLITEDWIIDYFDGRELARHEMYDGARTPLYMVASLAMYPGEVAQASGEYSLTLDYVRAYALDTVVPPPPGPGHGHGKGHAYGHDKQDHPGGDHQQGSAHANHHAAPIAYDDFVLV